MQKMFLHAPNTNYRKMLMDKFVQNAIFELEKNVSTMAGVVKIRQHPLQRDMVYIYFSDEAAKTAFLEEVYRNPTRGQLSTLHVSGECQLAGSTLRGEVGADKTAMDQTATDRASVPAKRAKGRAAVPYIHSAPFCEMIHLRR